MAPPCRGTSAPARSVGGSIQLGVNRGQREQKGVLRDIPKKGWCGVLLTLVRAISPLKLPSLNTDLYRLPIQGEPLV